MNRTLHSPETSLDVHSDEPEPHSRCAPHSGHADTLASDTPSRGGWTQGAWTAFRTFTEHLFRRRQSAADLHEAHGMRRPQPHRDQDLHGNIRWLQQVDAEDIMTPRADMVLVESSTSRDELLRLMAEKPHQRYPVFEGDPDNIVGMVLMHDLIQNMQTPGWAVRTACHPVIFIAPSLRALDILLEMKARKTNMALVVDEYGGIDGLVTPHDIIEQIIGDIPDVHNGLNPLRFHLVRPGVYDVSARMPLQQLEETFGALFSQSERDDNPDTLGGLAAEITGRVPGRGEIVIHPTSGLQMRILEADSRRIHTLRISRPSSMLTTEANNDTLRVS